MELLDEFAIEEWQLPRTAGFTVKPHPVEEDTSQFKMRPDQDLVRAMRGEK